MRSLCLLLLAAVAEGALLERRLCVDSVRLPRIVRRVPSPTRSQEEPPPPSPPSPPPPPARTLTPQEAIAAAEEKLANAPSSFNSWREKEPEPAVSGPLTPDQLDLVNQAPLFLGGLSLLLFLFNAVGAFGEGPDLDKLAADLEDWANAQ